MVARVALLRGQAADRVRPFQAGRASSRAGLTEGSSPGGSQDVAPVLGQAAASGPVAVPMAPAHAPDQPDPRLVALEARCAELASELATLRREQDSQQREAVEAAYRAGAASVVRSEEKALALLAEAATAALGRLDGTLTHLEEAAIGLARAALEPAFGADAPLEAITFAAIRHQLSQLRGNALVEVRLSPSTGLEAATVTRYLQASGQTAAKAVSDPALPAGSVALKLRLGEIQLDMVRHAEAVRSILSAGLPDITAEAGAGAP